MTLRKFRSQVNLSSLFYRILLYRISQGSHVTRNTPIRLAVKLSNLEEIDPQHLLTSTGLPTHPFYHCDEYLDIICDPSSPHHLSHPLWPTSLSSPCLDSCFTFYWATTTFHKFNFTLGAIFHFTKWSLEMQIIFSDSSSLIKTLSGFLLYMAFYCTAKPAVA